MPFIDKRTNKKNYFIFIDIAHWMLDFDERMREYLILFIRKLSLWTVKIAFYLLELPISNWKPTQKLSIFIILLLSVINDKIWLTAMSWCSRCSLLLLLLFVNSNQSHYNELTTV